MIDQNHHNTLVAALRNHWREAGGPISLTAYLLLCRPTIAPLLARGVPWSWIGARVLAVYESADAEVPADISPLTERKKKSIIELYSRATRRLRSSQEGSAAGTSHSAGVNLEIADPRQAGRPQQGVDPPHQRRARIKQSLEITSRLGQFD
ncbi:hypothetical protein [Pelagibacterium sediminicola]|uniref:hypothetical protein n=1 Tax=Pelagibacterium sediminicola TaxID=2248761 RepID=UPI000E322EA4|nr:hypothetical protein [Pelagibacterium sediminicola]